MARAKPLPDVELVGARQAVVVGVDLELDRGGRIGVVQAVVDVDAVGF